VGSFNHLVHEFRGWANREYNYDKSLNALSDHQKTWVLNSKDWPATYGVSQGYVRHGSNQSFDPTLGDTLRLTHWMMDHTESEAERVGMVLQLIDQMFADSKNISHLRRPSFSAPFKDLVLKYAAEGKI